MKALLPYLRGGVLTLLLLGLAGSVLFAITSMAGQMPYRSVGDIAESLQSAIIAVAIILLYRAGSHICAKRIGQREWAWMEMKVILICATINAIGILSNASPEDIAWTLVRNSTFDFMQTVAAERWIIWMMSVIYLIATTWAVFIIVTKTIDMLLWLTQSHKN